ncbi:MAG: LytTR family DNA-binding domain-containing protein [Vallitaleaceae bacterium]|nr:LytTR family DNA-binding domain-containing protein [Vallitaleaceae bacterium]
MIQVILVDDERPALEELSYLLKSYEDIRILGTYTDPMVALTKLHKTKVDVVFLDISMPEMDGLRLAKEIMKLPHPPLIVFATAFDEHALQAFDIHAIDYILKPLSEVRFDRTIQRIHDQLDNRSHQALSIKELISSTLQPRYDKLPVWKNDRIYLISKSDILFCTTNDNETRIVVKNEAYMVLETLSELELQLDEKNFFRCHRSFLINLDAIEEIIPWFNNTYAVKLLNYEEHIPISRRNTKTFKGLINMK